MGTAVIYTMPRYDSSNDFWLTFITYNIEIYGIK